MVASPRRRLLVASLAASVVLGFASVGRADEASTPASDSDDAAYLDAERGRFTIRAENDAFGLSGTDNGYTNGEVLSARFKADWLRKLLPHWRSHRVFLGWSGGQTMYTPTNLSEQNPAALRLDRPYGGWLFTGPSFEWRFSDGPFRRGYDTGVYVQLMGGPLGPGSGAEAVQKSWHALLRDLTGSSVPKEPKGWERNHMSGNAWGWNAFLAFDTELLPRPWRNIPGLGAHGVGSAGGVRLAALGDCAAGNVFDRCGFGIRPRIGLIAARTAAEREIPSVAPNATRAPPKVANTPPPDRADIEAFQPTVPIEFYVYGRLEHQFVGYNAFLDRPVCDDLAGCAPSYVKKVLVVADYEVGVVLRVGVVQLVWGQVWRSPEIFSPRAAYYSHNYGQVQLTFIYY